MDNILLLLTRQSDQEQVAALLRQEGLRPVIARNGVSLQSFLPEKPAMIVVDAFYGVGMVEELRKIFPRKPVLCLLPRHDGRQAVEMMRAGAFDCFSDAADKEDVLSIIHHVYRNYYGTSARSKGPGKGETSRRWWAAAGVAVALIGFAALGGVLSNNSTRPIRMELPYENPTSIVVAGDQAWIGNWFTQSVYWYRIDGRKLTLLGMNNFHNFGPVALAQEDNFLWTFGNDLVLRQHAVNNQLDVRKSYRLAEHAPSGMAFISSELWMCDSVTRQLYRFSLDGGVLAETYDTGLSMPVGPAWDGEHIWLADAKAETIALFRQEKGNFSVWKTYRLPGDNGQGVLSGISIYRNNLCLLYAGNPSYVIVYPVRLLKERA